MHAKDAIGTSGVQSGGRTRRRPRTSKTGAIQRV